MNEFKYETEFYKLEKKDDICYVTYINGPISLEVAKDLVSQRLRLTEGKSVLMVVAVKDLKGMDRDARSFLSSEEGCKGVKAGAIVVKSAFTTHMANFFMKISFSKSIMPARIFSSESEAVKWLRTHA